MTGLNDRSLVALAFALIAVATLTPLRDAAAGDRMPFWCLACGDFGVADALANVALFAPLGWALSRAGVRAGQAVGIILVTTIGIELLQAGVVRGRVASFSDILANTIGGLAGSRIPPLRRWIAASRARAGGATTLYGALLVTGLGAGVTVQAVPPLGRHRWTAEGSRLPGYTTFSGSVQSVSIDGAPAVRQEWRDRPASGLVQVAVKVSSGRPDTRWAEMISVHTPGGAWMWVDQRYRSLRVHLASASDRFGLRGHSPWFSAVTPDAAGEPMTIELAVQRFSYRIVTTTGRGESVRDVTISPGDAWRLFVPFERQRERWSPLLRGMWMAGLLGPLGYLAALRSRAGAVAAATGASVALILLPLVTGCAWLPFLGWCGAGSGWAIGVAAAGHDASQGGLR